MQASNARNLIDFVATNPAEFLSSGRLILFPYQKQEHGCTLCPENMCKGTKTCQSCIHPAGIILDEEGEVLHWDDSLEFFKLFKNVLG